MRKFAAAMLAILFGLVNAYAQTTDQKSKRDPYACLGVAANKSLSQIRKEIEILEAIKNKDAHTYCAIAELRKRIGDYEAEQYYKKAIEADEAEPAFELFFADYLRNFRGALHPLFPEAEEHYFAGLRKFKAIQDKKKLDCQDPKNKDDVDCQTRRRLERGLVALYQEDGFPVAHWRADSDGSAEELSRPFWFFSSINKSADSTGDFDRVDDTRSFTSEALFSSSATKLKRNLNEDELRGLIRSKQQFETLDRFRFRYKGMPALDVFYKYRNIQDAQITDFSKPGFFNDVKLNEYGIAAEKPFNVAHRFDLYLRGAYKRLEREGLIEFLPNAKENINQYESNAALSRFIGPDKLNVEYTIVYLDIDEHRPIPVERNRLIQGAKLTYQIFRPLPFLRGVYENRFETRGLDLFGGFLRDTEAFGQVDVKKNDIFFGASIKGIGKKGRMDITVQPTIFTSEVEGDASQKNSQYRTNASLLYRIVDEESHPEVPKKGGLHLAFLHLVIPFKQDVAINGPDDFENYKIGAELRSKFYSVGIRRTSFLLSLRYDFQNFYKLDRKFNLVGLTISMGF